MLFRSPLCLRPAGSTREQQGQAMREIRTLRVVRRIIAYEFACPECLDRLPSDLVPQHIFEDGHIDDIDDRGPDNRGLIRECLELDLSDLG